MLPWPYFATLVGTMRLSWAGPWENRRMEVSDIIKQLDEQISKLKQARALLAGSNVPSGPEPKRRGRPKRSKAVSPVAQKGASKRTLSL